jgi:predicted TIM-barrel fold metal-dependent hydrolase
MVDYDWVIAVCRAYNNWLSETYVRRDSRFKGMALLPMQEPAAAAEELERAVTELGMSGTMLASTGLPSPLGAKTYWPVYEVADRLGCAVAVHGGAHEGFGMDHFNVYAPVHALGHPFGQMVSFGNMIFNGVCDNFPNVKFGFLEAGVAWLLMCLERFDRSYETHKHYDLSGQLIRLRDGESVSKYVKRNIREGRIFVGCEGEEPELAYAISEVGAEPFVFSTDYPHEVTIEMCRHEIEELMETEDISDDAKDAVLYRNAQRFYNLAPVAVSA